MGDCSKRGDKRRSIGTKLFCAWAVFMLMNGCVTTTIGTTRSEPDKDDAAEQYYQLGAQYMRNGNYNLARDRLERSLEFDPRMAVAHSALALVFVKLDNLRLATEHYEKAVRYGPENFEVRNAYAVFLCQQNQFEEARRQFDKAIAAFDNDDAEVTLTNAGVCMVRKSDYVLAEKYFREALGRKASYGEALIQLASLKHKTDNDLYARAFLQRYLATNRVSAPVLFLGTEIEKSLGDNRASTDYGNQLLRDFPDSAEAKYLMSQH